MPEKIAIIGGGVAGLTAGYLLHDRYELTLFEKTNRIGGNAYTLTTSTGHEVDIAAAAFAKHSCKNLFKLFDRLGVKTARAFKINPLANTIALSFLNLDTQDGLYLTPGIKGLTAQRFAVLRPRRLLAFLRVDRAIRTLTAMMHDGELENLSLEQALAKVPWIKGETKLFFVGGLCLITSMHCEDVLDTPANFFFKKLGLHPDFLPPRLARSLCFNEHRTKDHIQALAQDWRERIVLNANIWAVSREQDAVTLVMADGQKLVFDWVIFACNADQALALLAEPTQEELRLLGAWRYTDGPIVVHTDHAHFPSRDLMGGYTFLYHLQDRYIKTSISGSLWMFPHAAKANHLISTQFPNFPIDESLIEFKKIFRTPLFDQKACTVADEMPSLNGVQNTYYCGSHFGFGTHEDAVTSAINAARMLGVDF